jgi:GR25 family glycosyltransferase involved in LPS biosynthesis
MKIKWRNKYIADSGFLINLNRRTDRLDESLLEFDRIGIDGIQRYEAVEIEKESMFSLLGCAQTHINIMKTQVESNSSSVMVFEDDFFLKEDNVINNRQFDSLIDIIVNYDYDLLMMGTSLKSQTEYKSLMVDVPKILNQTTCYISKLPFAKFTVSNYDFTNQNSIMFGEQIDTFINTLVTRKHWKYDHEIYDSEKILNHNLKIFCINPILFYQRKSFSDISKKLVNLSDYVYSNNVRYQNHGLVSQ